MTSMHIDSLSFADSGRNSSRGKCNRILRDPGKRGCIDKLIEGNSVGCETFVSSEDRLGDWLTDLSFCLSSKYLRIVDLAEFATLGMSSRLSSVYRHKANLQTERLM